MRDIFRVMDKSGKYEIDRYVQAINPISAIGQSPLIQPVLDVNDLYFDKKESNFNRRNAYLDFTKSVFSYLAQKKSDYLLLDMGDIRIDLTFYEKNKEKIASSFSMKRGSNYLRDKCLPKVWDTVGVLDMDEVWVRNHIEIYLDKILELYPQEKIIFFESHAVDTFYDRDTSGVRHGWENAAVKFNKSFALVFDYCLKKLPRAHVVRFPKYVLGDEHHVWGRYPLHYTDGFYRYAFEVVESIVSSKNRVEEEANLSYSRIRQEKVLLMEASMLKWLDLARIDIKNHGENNDVKVNVLEGARYDIKQAQWFSTAGNGYVMETYDKYLELELECKGTGLLQIRLLGVDRRSPKRERLPLWVDFTRLAVNDDVIFWELKSVWHDKSYSYTRQVTDGEKLKVEISLSPHGYRGEELTRLISLWTV